MSIILRSTKFEKCFRRHAFIMISLLTLYWHCRSVIEVTRRRRHLIIINKLLNLLMTE